jgi:hypothetical protein
MAPTVSTAETSVLVPQAFADNIPAILQNEEVRQMAADPRLRRYHELRKQHAALDTEIDEAQKSPVALRNKGLDFDLRKAKRERLQLAEAIARLERDLGITPIMKNMMLKTG